MNLSTFDFTGAAVRAFLDASFPKQRQTAPRRPKPKKTRMTLTPLSLALPDPAWHTADLSAWLAQRASHDELWTLSDDELLAKLDAQEQWMAFHFGHNHGPEFIFGQECQTIPATERNRRHDCALRVKGQIERAVIFRFGEMVKRAAQTKRRAGETRRWHAERKARVA